MICNIEQRGAETMRSFLIIFFFLVSSLDAHEKGNEHIHFLSVLHIQDIFAVAAALIAVFLVYRNLLGSK